MSMDGLRENETRDFGEVLRHELNNSLTGILGSAELLLVELRRKNVELLQSYFPKRSRAWRPLRCSRCA
jgi:signal transduction histidine kinase